MRTFASFPFAICLAAFALTSTITSPLQAGKFNPLLNIGDVAPTWQDLPGVDGKNHSSDQLKDKDVVVVAFTCNSCPTAVDYEDRLMALVSQHAASGKVAVVAINANLVADDLLPKMQERATLKKYNYAYVHDDTQKVAKAFGASYTPEFFVLNKERKIVYMGAMDDNTDAAGVKTKYVADAVAAALSGKSPETAETPARGCAVRYARERRKP